MIEDIITSFPQQFAWNPQIQNKAKLKPYRRVVVAGMGGSHLAADILLRLRPDLPLTIHSDYGLPFISPEEESHTLVIASSYSGNTEETLDALEAAVKKNIPAAAVAVGGKLITQAQHLGIPYVQMPDTGIQPRLALGYSIMSMLALLGSTRELEEASGLASALNAANLKINGEHLAKNIIGKIPVIYSSNNNRAVAYNWKIKLNETGKIPAFYNVLPEMNHNEMNGFDVAPPSKGLSEKFVFLFLEDATDHPKVQTRMRIVQKLYTDRSLPCVRVPLEGETPLKRIFQSLIVADWASVAVARAYGQEPEQVPMVEEFKQLIAKPSEEI